MGSVSHGFLWSGIEKFSIQGISFLLSIIIARIVSPSSYGLIVMIQVFLSFSQLFIDSGFASALIQKKDRTDVDYHTVFIFNMGVAIGLYILFFFIAPFIADFYEEPQLVMITRVISLNLIISSISIVQKTRLTINLDFKTQTKAGLMAVLISGIIGVVCAYSGMEVWALVVQGIVSNIIISVSLICYSRWIPRLIFSVQSFKSLFNFGSKMLVANLLTSIFMNINNLVIGKKYSSADLAFYNRGFTLSMFPSTNIADVLNRVIYPVLSRLQNDMVELRKAYLKYLHLSNYIILPLMGLLIVLARPLIDVVLTPKWNDSVPYIRIISLNFMFYPLILQSSNPVAAIGHSGVLLKYQFVKRLVSLVILICTITISITAICWGMVVGAAFEAIVNVYVNKKEIGAGFMEHFYSQIDVILLTVVVCIIAYIPTLFISNSLFQLLLGCSFGITIYFVGTYVFNIMEKEYVSRLIQSLKCRFFN